MFVRRFQLIAGLVLTSSLVSMSCLSAAEPDTKAAERAEAFTWFNGLGYPDVKSALFVRVSTGYWSQGGDTPPKITYREGFLLSQEDKRFTVLFSDLSTRTFTKSPPGTKEHERRDFEVIDLPRYAADSLQILRAADPSRRFPWRRDFEQLSERAEVFVLAWGCWRNEHNDIAGELYDHASQMVSRRDISTRPLKFPQKLAADIAHAEMWRAILQFEDITIPRERLLIAFEHIVKSYPKSEHVGRAKETASLLLKMIQEDKEHAEKRRADKPLDHLEQEEKIAELIFQLRDQNGYQLGQPGSCDIFHPRGGKQDTPAHQLREIGYDAVPQLIEALEDDRFTRSVSFHRNFFFSHTVLRVGDCAERILMEIAGGPLHEPGSLPEENRSAALKKVVSAWYENLQQKGEKRLLLEEVEAGNQRAVHLAHRLVTNYPEAALPALIAGARNAKTPWARAHLVSWAGKLPGDGPLPFLLDELKNGPAPESRLEAARAAYRRGRAEAVTAMIAEWDRSCERARDLFSDDSYLASFLASCGKVEAIEALARNLQSRPVQLRLRVVSAFRDGFAPGAFSPDARGDQPAVQAELRGAILKLLLATLDDTAETGMSGSWGDTEFSNPRICDIAGYVLNRLDKSRYAFDLESSSEQRDRDRLALKTLLRKELGLPPTKR